MYKLIVNLDISVYGGINSSLSTRTLCTRKLHRRRCLTIPSYNVPVSAMFIRNHEKPLIIYDQNNGNWIVSVLNFRAEDIVCFLVQCAIVTKQRYNAVPSC